MVFDGRPAVTYKYRSLSNFFWIILRRLGIILPVYHYIFQVTNLQFIGKSVRDKESVFTLEICCDNFLDFAVLRNSIMLFVFIQSNIILSETFLYVAR